MFVVPHLKAGERRDIYGKALSTLKAGAWLTGFELDNNPIPDMGKPRDLFSGRRVIVRGSAEENEFRAQLRRQREETETKNRATLISVVSAGRTFDGAGHQDGAVWPFKITFTSFDASSGKVLGQMELPTFDSILRIEGRVSGGSLVFRTTEYIRRGSAVIGAVYALHLINGTRMEGKWTPSGRISYLLPSAVSPR